MIVHPAHPPCHRSVIGNGFLQFETDHAVLTRHLLGGPDQEIMHDLVGVPPVEIIRIDHGKRLSDLILGHQHGMCGSPWLLPIRRY